MKKKLVDIAAATLAIAPLIFAHVSQAKPEVTLKLHHLLGPKSPAQVTMIEPWVKAVEKSSYGKLEPVVDGWIADVKGKGIDGRTLVDVARKEIAKYSNMH